MYPRNMIRLCGYLFFCAVINSCFSVGNNFPSEISWVTKEKTRYNDVQLLLGKPHAVGRSADALTWTYSYYNYSLFGSNYYKGLKFYWNLDKTVKHFHFTSNFPLDIKKLSVVKHD